MKTLTFAIMLLTAGIMQAQNSTKANSISTKEKVIQLLTSKSSEVTSNSNGSYQLSLFPNPVTSHLHVNSTGLIKKIALVRNDGRVAKRIRLRGAKSYTFDTSSLKTGAYTVVILHHDQTVRTEFYQKES